MYVSQDTSFPKSKTFQVIQVEPPSLFETYAIGKENKTKIAFYFHLYVGILSGVVPYSFVVNEKTGVKVLGESTKFRKVRF